ncbi:MAG: hypothetical protein FJZ01_06080 [Candidatus Sericytochromatia bacterium]|nr:hypothetical protein [Candidatus Tanganyikabacteria bacterium]
MTHAANILEPLDRQRCEKCGAQAARGTTICVPCASKATGELQVLPKKRRPPR